MERRREGDFEVVCSGVRVREIGVVFTTPTTVVSNVHIETISIQFQQWNRYTQLRTFNFRKFKNHKIANAS